MCTSSMKPAQMIKESSENYSIIEAGDVVFETLESTQNPFQTYIINHFQRVNTCTVPF